jgi:hypothetical protein
MSIATMLCGIVPTPLTVMPTPLTVTPTSVALIGIWSSTPELMQAAGQRLERRWNGIQ